MTISAKPVGVGAVSQLLIVRGEPSGLWTHTATTEGALSETRITGLLVSSPSEFPMQRNREDGFFGSTGLRERNPATRFRLIVI